ncbi:MAG: hypothetical protein ACPGO5_04240 [Patescibacteria group bacterium]
MNEGAPHFTASKAEQCSDQHNFKLGNNKLFFAKPPSNWKHYGEYYTPAGLGASQKYPLELIKRLIDHYGGKKKPEGAF